MGNIGSAEACGIFMLTWSKLLPHIGEEEIICKSDVDALPQVPQGSEFTFQNADDSESFILSSPVRSCLWDAGKSRSEDLGRA